MARDPDSARSPLAPFVHFAFIGAAALGVFAFVSVAKESEARRRCSATCVVKPTYAGYERTAPGFTLKDVNGHDVSLDSFRGKVVVLNFWTRTCKPCIEEMPDIADLARILKPKSDVAVIAVSTDDTAQEARDTLKAALRADPPFTVLMDPDAKHVTGKYGTTLYPETWIIDKNGVIRARFDGARDWSSASVVQLVDEIRSGGYCEVQAREGRFVGKDAPICESINGG